MHLLEGFICNLHENKKKRWSNNLTQQYFFWLFKNILMCFFRELDWSIFFWCLKYITCMKNQPNIFYSFKITAIFIFLWKEYFKKSETVTHFHRIIFGWCLWILLTSGGVYGEIGKILPQKNIGEGNVNPGTSAINWLQHISSLRTAVTVLRVTAVVNSRGEQTWLISSQKSPVHLGFLCSPVNLSIGKLEENRNFFLHMTPVWRIE